MPRPKKAKQNDRLTIMQVAVQIGKEYQQTRTLMQRHFDLMQCHYDHRTRKLTCTQDGVRAYLATQKTPKSTPPPQAA